MAGPSGTTDRLFELAQYLGLLTTKEDYLVFRLACLSYLLTIEAHSFHEVMLGAMPYGLSYTPSPNIYVELFPEDATFSTLVQKTLLEDFPKTALPSYYLGEAFQQHVWEMLRGSL